jgi:hypothetical protein
LQEEARAKAEAVAKAREEQKRKAEEARAAAVEAARKKQVRGSRVQQGVRCAGFCSITQVKLNCWLGQYEARPHAGNFFWASKLQTAERSLAA